MKNITLEEMLAKGIKSNWKFKIEHELIDGIELKRFISEPKFDECLPMRELFNQLDYYFGRSDIEEILKNGIFKVERWG